MPYFILKYATTSLEIGSVFPQIQKMSPNYDFRSHNSVYALSKIIDGFPDFIPNLDYFILNSKSKLTDMLSCALLSTSEIIVSDKFKDLLMRFRLISHKFYEANVFFKNYHHHYNLIHIVPDLIHYVDFQQSTFVVQLNYSHTLGQVEIKSVDDYHMQKEKLKSENEGKAVSIWAERISFLPNFDAGLDFFKIGTFDTNIYISDRMKSEMVSENITGCVLSPARNLLTTS